MNQKPLEDMTRDELRAIAKALEITGYTKLTKPDLLKAIITKYMQIKHVESLVTNRLHNSARAEAYASQNGSGLFSPRQRKRLLKARNRADKRGEIMDALWTTGVWK